MTSLCGGWIGRKAVLEVERSVRSYSDFLLGRREGKKESILSVPFLVGR